MSRLFIGIDSGTQSTRVLAVDGDTARIAAEHATPYGVLPSDVPGTKEQDPAMWVDAAAAGMTAVLSCGGVRPADVAAIGISGQQHGFVPLDEANRVIRPAKLWCDTSTAREAEELVRRIGGLERTIAIIGTGIPAGFTASKVLWLKEHEPANYARLASILLPHDYLAFWLTGTKVMEWGDGSGTALMDVRTRTWAPDVLAAIDEGLAAKLPALIHPRTPVGVVKPDLARRWGLRPDVVVTGSGDNMMGAIGTGNVREGIVTASLGTSGTIYACTERAVIDPRGEIAAFCDATGRWLPLACTMNVTVATELVCRLFGLDHDGLTRAAAETPPGADGLVLVPFLEGERTPNVPEGTGVWIGARERTLTVGHMARAAIEGVTLGLNYGLNRMRDLGLSPTEVRLTGGGARNPLWRQIAADVFACPVACPSVREGAAFGAALHAQWAWEHTFGSGVDIGDLTDRAIGVDNAMRAEPRAGAVRTYAALQGVFDDTAACLPPAFARHRRFITAGVR
ncbi:MAG: xylulokinase [Acidobacteriota bacterium]